MQPPFEAFAQSCRAFMPGLVLPFFDRRVIFCNTTGKPPEFGSYSWKFGGRMEMWRPDRTGTTDYSMNDTGFGEGG